MSGARLKAPTRSAVLVMYAQLQAAETGISLQKFADALAERYADMVPEGSRRAPLKVAPTHGNADDYYRVVAANFKAVQRYLDGTVPIPTDVEEAWVAALTERYRDGCIFDLCARYNVLPVRIHGETEVTALAGLMRDEAAVIEAMAPIMADGVIDAADLPLVDSATKAIKRLMADCAGFLRQLELVSGERASLTVVGESKHG